MKDVNELPLLFFSPEGELVYSIIGKETKGITTRVRDGKVIADYRHLVENAQSARAEVGSLDVYTNAKEARVIDRLTGQFIHTFHLHGDKDYHKFELWAGGKILTAHTEPNPFKPYIWTATDPEPKPLQS